MQGVQPKMNFKELEIEDQYLVEKYFSKYKTFHSEASFVDSFCASERYRCQWCQYGGFFSLRRRSDDGGLLYVQPIGDGNLATIIRAMKENAGDEGFPLLIGGVTPEFISRMRVDFPHWGFAADRNSADYIYRASDLKYLPGAKYRIKRKLIHKFATRCDFRYEELRPSLFSDCLKLEKLWLKRKLSDSRLSPNEEWEKELTDELHYIERAFTYYERLRFYGGAIYVDDTIVAFSFGSPLNDRVFCTHIQKADTDYPEAFTVIDNQLILHLPESFQYINTQWDGGIAGLRRAKSLYCPAFLAEYMIGRELSSEEQRIRALWLTCFPKDTLEFVDSFVLNRYHTLPSFSHWVDGQIVSIMFIVPFGDTAYIYATMTDPGHRGKGFFRSLFLEAVEYCQRSGFKYLTVIPVKNLASWYEKQGFGGRYQLSFRTYDDFDFGTGDRALNIGLMRSLDGSPLPKENELVLKEKL